MPATDLMHACMHACRHGECETVPCMRACSVMGMHNMHAVMGLKRRNQIGDITALSAKVTTIIAETLLPRLWASAKYAKYAKPLLTVSPSHDTYSVHSAAMPSGFAMSFCCQTAWTAAHM